ncbi:MAG: hypothetical protein QOH06_1228 [Acidobacteriota bacterium]|jgi:hypothetical protein|nr:hypothetical protein [Acidobacteriota bacterium]
MKKATFTILLLTILALAAMVTVPSLDAASNCTYYSNASHTTVVGQYGYDCCNNKVAWGIKTQFSVCGGCFICYPPPPGK